MTLNQLKYAIIVAESESFNEAAKKLFISQVFQLQYIP